MKELSDSELFDEAMNSEAAKPEPAQEPEPEAKEPDPQPEVTEPEPEKEPEAAQTEAAEPEPEPDPEPQRDDLGRVPSGVFRDEAERRRAAEKALEDAQKQTADLQAQMQQLQTMFMQQQQPQPQTPQEQPQMPDPFTDPEGALQFQQKQFQQEMNQMRVNTSLDIAEAKYGEEFSTAYQSLMQSGNQQLANQILNSPNPGEALVQEFRTRSLVHKTGGNLDAYLEQQRQDLLNDPAFLEQAAAKLRESAPATTPSGQPHVNIPTSVSKGTSAASSAPAQIQSQSDSELFGEFS